MATSMMFRHGSGHGSFSFLRFRPHFVYQCNLSFSTTRMNHVKRHLKRTFPRNQIEPSTTYSDNDIDRRGMENHRNVNNSRSSPNERFANNNLSYSHEGNYPEDGRSAVIPSHIKYHMLSESDKKFGPEIMQTKNRRQREKKKIFLLEGSRHILDAVNAGVKIVSLFFAKGEQLEHFPLDAMVADGTELYKVKMGHMQLWTDLVKASGIMAVCKVPNPGEAIIPMEDPLPLTLVCDGVHDHGNLGLLLRSAAAVGCEKVLLTSGCVDPWEPKVVRSAAGALYHLCLLNNVKWELLANYLHPQAHICVTDGSQQLDMPEVFKRNSKKIAEYKAIEMEEFVEDSREQLVVDSSCLDQELVEAFSDVPLPVTDYFNENYTRSPTVIIVCGDNEGISAQAKKLVYTKHGEVLSIPMATGINSVNCAVGGSLVLFEVKRQHMLMMNNSQ